MKAHSYTKIKEHRKYDTEAAWASFLACLLLSVALFSYLKIAVITICSQSYAFTEVVGQIDRPKVDEDVLINESHDLLYSHIEYEYAGNKYLFYINNRKTLGYHYKLLNKYFTTESPELKFPITVYVCKAFPQIYSLYKLPPWPSQNPQYAIILILYISFLSIFVLSLLKLFLHKKRHRYIRPRIRKKY